MKNHITPRKRFGLPEQLAYASLRSAIRPLLRADAFVAVVVIPPGADIGPYIRAADAMLSSANRYRRTAAIVDFDPKRPLNSAKQITGALDEKKVVLLFPDEASITVPARLAADVVVRLKPPTIGQAKGVFRSLYGGRLTNQQVEIFLLLDEEMQRAVVRPGRSVGRMLAQLVMRPETPRDVRKPPPVRPSEDDVELRLESMSGYGEARVWGLQLKQDLKDWKDGRIPWSDVDRGLLLSGRRASARRSSRKRLRTPAARSSSSAPLPAGRRRAIWETCRGRCSRRSRTQERQRPRSCSSTRSMDSPTAKATTATTAATFGR